MFEANLLTPNAFDAACAGAHYVMHTASPYTLDTKDAKKDLLEPALNGTLNVLQSATKSGTVKRVVLTSSVAGRSSLRCLFVCCVVSLSLCSICCVRCSSADHCLCVAQRSLTRRIRSTRTAKPIGTCCPASHATRITTPKKWPKKPRGSTPAKTASIWSSSTRSWCSALRSVPSK
jgi:hypothetical protein